MFFEINSQKEKKTQAALKSFEFLSALIHKHLKKSIFKEKIAETSSTSCTYSIFKPKL